MPRISFPKHHFFARMPSIDRSRSVGVTSHSRSLIPVFMLALAASARGAALSPLLQAVQFRLRGTRVKRFSASPLFRASSFTFSLFGCSSPRTHPCGRGRKIPAKVTSCLVADDGDGPISIHLLVQNLAVSMDAGVNENFLFLVSSYFQVDNKL